MHPGDAVYDYVVVDAGNVGALPAHRLAVARHTFALVEAAVSKDADLDSEIGNSNVSQIPANGLCFMGKDPNETNSQPIDWNSVTSSRNSILPYSMKEQRFTLPNKDLRFVKSMPEYDLATLDRPGPVDVSFPTMSTDSFASWAVQVFQELSLATMRGFSSGQLPTDQLRASYKTICLNLLSTHAKQIISTDNSTAARGVRVGAEGLKYMPSARNQVIVSAGAFKALQLLMVSGIGPASSLERHNIPICRTEPAAAPQDHVLASPSYRVKVITGSSIAVPSHRAQAQSPFNARPPRGPLTNPGVDTLCKSRSPTAPISPRRLKKSTLPFPPTGRRSSTSPSTGPLATRGNYAQGPDEGYNCVAMGSALVALLSRGGVDIASTDTEDSPVIDPRWFSHPGDFEVAIAAFRRSREIYPRLGVQSDDEIVELLRNASNTVHDACCTAAMGQGLRVSNLPVVDASIMPFLTPGHPISLLRGLAERIADA
ncbi:hypothetical protein BJX68DRAFT_257412 [Aspergillus pseudodeflectus]|uniref:Glucose-methanol-choline oxidoreductase N-terminal domain-containing protein n=1 Tax=Aspergillus pseudodeflectus TaxID=176178 RepID=A0ABR4JU64_9EURO